MLCVSHDSQSLTQTYLDAMSACHSPSAAACFLAFSLRSAMLEFLLVFLAAAAAATTEAAEADSAASVARGNPNGGPGNIM